MPSDFSLKIVAIALAAVVARCSYQWYRRLVTNGRARLVTQVVTLGAVSTNHRPGRGPPGELALIGGADNGLVTPGQQVSHCHRRHYIQSRLIDKSLINPKLTNLAPVARCFNE